jgi:hydrogenase expression/formation protein HypC
MCLGIVGQVVSLDDTRPDLALVDVAGAQRTINIGILAGEAIAAGDWILIHAGFAMEKIDAETAANQMAVLRDYTGGPSDLALDEMEERRS